MCSISPVHRVLLYKPKWRLLQWETEALRAFCLVASLTNETAFLQETYLCRLYIPHQLLTNQSSIPQSLVTSESTSFARSWLSSSFQTLSNNLFNRNYRILWSRIWLPWAHLDVHLWTLSSQCLEGLHRSLADSYPGCFILQWSLYASVLRNKNSEYTRICSVKDRSTSTKPSLDPSWRLKPGHLTWMTYQLQRSRSSSHGSTTVISYTSFQTIT